MFRLTFSLIAGTLLAGAASAQSLVIGSSIGQECYNAALLSRAVPISRERVCNEAIESHKLSKRDLAATHINRGIIRMNSNRLDTALEDYSKASKLRPNFGPIYLNQGAAMISAGHFEAAIESLNKALELDTQDPHAAHFNLGLAYERTGDVTSAYYAFRKALELKPDWSLAEAQIERFTVVSEG